MDESTDGGPNDKVYIHEFIDIIGHNRANYMHHMTANWSPIAQDERHQLCYGVWGVVGTTRGWPEVREHLGGGRLPRPQHARSSTSSTTRACRTRSSRSGGRRPPTTAATATTAC